jgi:hypothetical protein
MVMDELIRRILTHKCWTFYVTILNSSMQSIEVLPIENRVKHLSGLKDKRIYYVRNG